jgi:four helix bundle protein
MSSATGRPASDNTLRERTKALAARVVRLVTALPKDLVAQVIGKQLLRSGTSVGAHYREAQRSRSPAELISKIEVGIQELEESDYWIDLLMECEIIKAERLNPLKQEVQELLAMLTASVRTVKSKSKIG